MVGVTTLSGGTGAGYCVVGVEVRSLRSVVVEVSPVGLLVAVLVSSPTMMGAAATTST